MTQAQRDERIADALHGLWSRWTRYFLSRCWQNQDGSLTIPAEYVERWTRQMNLPYVMLSKHEQQSDLDLVNHITPIIDDCIREAQS